MATFTCLNCHVAFADCEGQRDHFRSDWHRYNLMRKVSELPPVSRETYNEKVVQVQGQTAMAEAEANSKKPYCQPCKKTFSTQMAYDNHVKSNKHIKMTMNYTEGQENKKNKAMSVKNEEKQKEEEDADDDDDDMEVEEVDSDEWDEEVEGEPIPLNDCLFCTHHSATLEKKLEHMMKAHSFFIPDLDYCTDVAGLITYLGWKLGCGFECLSCNWRAKSYPSIVSVRQHIIDKGHTGIELRGDKLLEYSEFYDYSSSYPDAETANPDEDADLNVVSGDAYELVLPSGDVIGHRDLRRFYKQKLKPNSSNQIVAKRHGSSFKTIIGQYRSLGWTGATGKDALKKARDQKYVQHVRGKHHVGVGVKANKLQHYFRNQNPV